MPSHTPPIAAKAEPVAGGGPRQVWLSPWLGTLLGCWLRHFQQPKRLASKDPAEVKAAKDADIADRAQKEDDLVQLQKDLGRREDELQRKAANRQKIAARPDRHDKPPQASATVSRPAPAALQGPLKKRKKTFEDGDSADSGQHGRATDNAPLQPPKKRRGREPKSDSEGQPMEEDKVRLVKPLLEDDGAGKRRDEEDEDDALLSDAVSVKGGPPTSIASDSDAGMLDPHGFEDDADKDDDLDYTEEGDGDDDDDDDDMEEGDEEEGVRRVKKTPSQKKPKASKGVAFRTAVGSHRKIIAPAPISKPVANIIKSRATDTDTAADAGLKGTKRQAPTGLLAGYKLKSKIKFNDPDEEDEDEEEGFEYNGGEYDADEREESVNAGRAGKSTMRGRKAETKCRVEENANAPTGSTRVKALPLEKKVSNLPFPSDSRVECIAIWKTDPFASGTFLSPEFKIIWRLGFDELAPLDDHDPSWRLSEAIANDVLLLYRSDLGKTAVSTVVEALRDCLDDELERGCGREAAVEYAKDLLEDMQFVYGKLDAKEGESALPFQGSLVINVFSWHMKQVARMLPGYKSRRAIGGLAMCAATIERALTYVRDGEINIEVWPPPSEKPRPGAKRAKPPYPAFSEALWGSQVRAFVTAAKKLTKQQWEDIHDAASLPRPTKSWI
ncbi:hypothetical protein NMY22_g13795 [Coprinellus aureogranulatus]|nr:hypothetical protein NMY22_g13795 [Coprinellus aureogranulatus]